MLCLASTLSGTEPSLQTTVCAKGNSICIPQNYSKFDLPNETQTTVSVGIDIKERFLKRITQGVSVMTSLLLKLKLLDFSYF